MKIERLKLVSNYFIHILSISLNGYKPFNPIIGETWQSEIYPPEYCFKNKDNNKELEYCEIDKSNSTKVYAEQTSHHPPVFNFYVKNENYICHGYRSFEATANGNTVNARLNGPFIIDYKDGTRIESRFCKFYMQGVMMGKRLFSYEGNLVIEDKTNNLISIMELNPKEKKGLIGSLFGSKNKNFPDYFRGFIAQKSDVTYDSKTDTYSCPNDAVLSKIEGEYSSFCNFDDKTYWKSGELVPGKAYRMDYTIPSDCQFREDILLYRAGKNELAQYAKMKIEDTQRKDAKLRKHK